MSRAMTSIQPSKFPTWEGEVRPMPKATNRPTPTPDQIDTAKEIADLWGHGENPAFINCVAMAFARHSAEGRERGIGLADPPADKFAPGSFGCHEALHMALVFGETVEAYLCDHDAVKANPAWLALADKAKQALFELYLAIGAEHLQAPLPGPPR